MRNVVVYTLLSLDGVAESPDRFVFDFDEVMSEHLGEVISTQDAVLLGRRMYDEWAGFWPSADIEPFASFINAVDKHVVTSTDLDPPWAGATRVEAPLEAFVRDLKAGPGGDIGVHGSLTLARSLYDLGLVDELRLVVSPAVAGEGRALFERGTPAGRLDLVRSTPSPTGSLLLRYAVRSGD